MYRIIWQVNCEKVVKCASHDILYKFNDLSLVAVRLADILLPYTKNYDRCNHTVNFQQLYREYFVILLHHR